MVENCKNCGHWKESHYPKDKMECNFLSCDCAEFTQEKKDGQ